MYTYELYVVTNLINGKKYVGQTRSDIGYLSRFRQHCSNARNNSHPSCFHNAIRKYGEDCFSVKRILKNIEQERIDFLECLWIQKLDTFYKNGNGYNFTLGGQGVHGYRHTEETKKKISASGIGKTYTKQRSEQIVKTCRERGFYERRSKNPIWKKKISDAAKKRVGNLNPFYGKHHTEETKKILSKSHGLKVDMLDIHTGDILCTFDSAAEAGKYLINIGVTKNKTPNCRILMVCNGTAKTAYGFKWKFSEV